MIGSYNFCNTDHFSLSENNCLEELEIRDHSFYRIDPANRMNRTFSLVDCANLRSIIIGSFSFQFFSGEFELSRLPSLELLKIGVINDSSANFNHCNFILKGKRFVRRFIHRSEEIENHRAGRSRVWGAREDWALWYFDWLIGCWWIDLPELRTLKIGWTTFSGGQNNSTLIMKRTLFDCSKPTR